MPASSPYHASLLKAVNQYFDAQGYRLMYQHRLSKQAFMGSELYQGLTQVDRIGKTWMIKWQLQDLDDNQLETQTQSLPISPLAVERQHLQQIAAACDTNSVKQSNHLCCIPCIKPIATIQLIVEGRKWQLTGFSMPYFEQGSVKEYLKRYPLSDEQKLQLIHKLAQSVSDLHKLGWIHGDIKSSNFLIAESEAELIEKTEKQPKQNKEDGFNGLTVVITDLAYAVPIDQRLDDSNSRHPRGTAAYLAPECWQGHSISVQSDIYAFGIMMYEILVGDRPFQMNKDRHNYSLSTDWAVMHCQAEVPLLSKQWSYLQTVIDTLLAKRLENRFKSMDQVIEALVAPQHQV